MATLVLTAVGSAVGGPIGGAIGALIGQSVDHALFGPKRREGPRLVELSVQTSSYGAQIPKLFGTMRVAGTVIWATDLKEHRARSGGGKGRPATTSYSYSASFAVACCATSSIRASPSSRPATNWSSPAPARRSGNVHPRKGERERRYTRPHARGGV